ncbi:MAG: C-terminal binding protein [Clostridia bacterium]|nr:C-terminal binding protein [Clostridia bacterium]
MSKFKVYISDFDYGDNDVEKSILEPIGAEVIGLHSKTGKGLAEQAKDADAIIQQYAKITRETIEQLENCKIIARYGIGVDILDVQACYDNNIVVTNVPDYCLDEVANHAITLSFTLMRNIPWYDKAVKHGEYRWQSWRGPVPRLRDSTFGLIGFGRIAQNMTRKLLAFGARVIAYDPYVSKSFMATVGAEKVELDQIFKQSNSVNVMCPYNEDTHHIVNERTLNLMREDAYLVCVSRGKCVDNKALYHALVNKKIVGAALDDPEEEPMKMNNWTPDMNPLTTLDNCILTPHTAYVSAGALAECRKVASENVKAVLLGKKPFDIVKP